MSLSFCKQNKNLPALITLSFITVFIVGCSKSNSGSVDGQTIPSFDMPGIAETDTNGTNDNGTDTATGSEANSADNSNTAEGSTGESEPTDNTTVIDSSDTTPTTTRVTVSITVPVYVSDSLQVRLLWGEKDLAAGWVTDESWEIADDFPVNTSNSITVTFSDKNGAVILASYTAEFTTGADQAQTLQITTDQFDTEQWDSDNDGVSNLDESRNKTNPLEEDLPGPVQAALQALGDKTFRISWESAAGADFYRVLENPDGVSGYVQIGEDQNSAIRTLEHRVALFKMINARYIVQACNAAGCVDSAEQSVSDTLAQSIVYLKASNTSSIDFFGAAVSLSADGNTLVVAASFESSISVGVNGSQNNNSVSAAGAVYVFTRENEAWQQSAYIKASNTGSGDIFGTSVSLSANGDTLAVGAYLEDSAATGVNGNQNDNSADGAGAVYVFTNSNDTWQQEAYLKADYNLVSDLYQGGLFGIDVSLSADGNTLAVGASGEDSTVKGINTPRTESTVSNSGAAYIFQRSGGQWEQQAFIKASNTDWGDQFGQSVSLSSDGNLLAVGAIDEQSGATGVNGIETDNSIAGGAGAVFLYERNNTTWTKQSYIKASNPGDGDRFGWSVDLSGDGNTLAVGAFIEDSSAAGINSVQNDNSAENAGAVYVYAYTSQGWQQEAYLKASNTDASDQFGYAVSLSADGNTLVVGAPNEQSADTGINGNQFDNSAERAGAAYAFVRSDGAWRQQSYIKASNTDGGLGYGGGDSFGIAVALSSDGNTLAVGAENEDGGARGIGGSQADNSAHRAGAVYLY